MDRKSLFVLMAVLFFIMNPFFLAAALAAGNEEPQISSEAAILIDGTTGKVLFGKNERRKMYPASITKIVTGLMAIETGNPDDTVTISKHAQSTEGSKVYLLEGEKVPLFKLVQGLLINSGNDAAVAIAEHLSGSEEAFAQAMNRYVRDKIGVTDTHFVNPHGLHHPQHVTTAYDMAMIARYAMQNEVFKSVVSTKELVWKGEGWNTIIYNHNQLLWRYKGTNGVKNGYTRQAGNTLVASAERDGTLLIAVVLNANSAEQAYRDTIALFDYGFSHFQTNRLTKEELSFLSPVKNYLPPEEVAFTNRKGEEYTVEVTESGQLRIRGEEGEILHQQKLSPLPLQPADKANNKLLPQHVIGWISWTLFGIYGLFLLLIKFFLQKRYPNPF